LAADKAATEQARAGRWVEVAVEASPEAAEAVYAIFHRWGHGGVAIEVPSQPPALDEHAWAAAPQPVPDASVVVKTYLPVGPGLEARRRGLERDLWHLQAFGLGRIGSVQTRTLAEEDWAEAWKEHYHVHRVGRRFVIKPSWRAYTPQPDDLVLELDPGMAFGTGLHPTTQLCLIALEQHPPTGQVVLDLGTGSGILAIGAARLGARRVLALDVDPVAVHAAKANVRRNRLARVVTVAQGTIELSGQIRQTGAPMRDLPVGPFALVLANIIAGVIIELAPGLAAVCRPGGRLIASGILTERLPEVQDVLARRGFTCCETMTSGDWAAVQAVRR
jgi:ribosomal protein L11 methyltransferase